MNATVEVPVYSQAGSRAFDMWLQERLREITRDVSRALAGNLVALILGGGYGRGEGGVVGTPGRERPHNDLDLVVVVRHRAGVGARLQAVSRRHEESLHIAVDFSRPLTLADIERWDHRLRWHELYHGHLVLAGSPSVLIDHAPPQIADPVPLGEAARLLVNRGAGLVWAKRVMQGLERPPDPDFVRRNAYKALLAVGDAYLIAKGELAPRHAGRDVLLRARGAPGLVLDAYAAALRFKFKPDAPGPPAGGDPVTRASGLWAGAFLAVESRRHGRAFRTLAEYAGWGGRREPAPAARWPRNLASNLRFGQVSLAAPQEPLYAQVASLLDGEPGAGWSARSRLFLDRWQRVND